MAHLTATHADLLTAGGIDLDYAVAAGVHSITEPDQVPAVFAGLDVDRLLPALAFEHQSADGTVVTQLRPDTPYLPAGGIKPAKYLWPKGVGLVLSRRRDGDGPVLLVEGTKQALAAAQYAPENWAVLGMVGCRGWYRDGAPNADLAIADGRDVTVVLDSDAATNLDVYAAGLDLAEALKLEGAASVAFVQLPGSAKAGLDDILGGRAPNRRADYLARLIVNAKPKPAAAKPKARSGGGGGLPEPTPDRGVVLVNGDRWETIGALTTSLRGRWDANRLFNFGGVLAERGARGMTPITKDAFNDLVAETCRTVAKSGEDTYVDCWPDANTTGAVLSRPERFSQLDKLSSVPFVRPDGTVCTTPGYDLETRTYLTLGVDLADVVVPMHPTPGQLKEAVRLLTDELLEGFPFPEPSDRAGAIATLLTPFIRGMVPVSPLAVVDGKEAGSGKNLFADILSIIVSGRATTPLPYSTDDAEQRKVVTSAFRSGAELFVFDEAHKLDGPSLARALTSHTYSDRILGGSNLAEWPNNVTWVSLGNQVTVLGDLGRRVYRIRLSYPGASPEHRPESDFRHPDLRAWASEHRAELVSALLTLVRGWFDANCPRADLPVLMGSFESWQRVVGGVLQHAGVTGFLDGTREWRSESDYERQHWAGHLAWLRATFGDKTFTSGLATEKLDRDRNAEYPEGLVDPSERGYSRRLGIAYGRQVGRWLDGHRLIKLAGKAHGNSIKWAVETGGEGGGPEVNLGSPHNDLDKSPEKEDQVGVVGVVQGALIPDTHRNVVLTKISNQTVTQAPQKHVTRRGVVEGPPKNPHSPHADPLDHVRHLSVPRVTQCEYCGHALELVPPAYLWFACRTCHPTTFS